MDGVETSSLGMTEEAAMDVDDIQLSPGLEEIFEAGQFSKCEIDLATLFDAEGNLKASNDQRDDFLELSCLNEIRSPDDFLPSKVFVRSEMQTMFSELLTKADRREKKKILTGSPGIGKSVLFFLLALRYQLLPENGQKESSLHPESGGRRYFFLFVGTW